MPLVPLLLGLCFEGGRGDLTTTDDIFRIIGGQEAKPEEYRFAAYLSTSLGGCTSSIIHSEWILTAAHCVHGYKSATVIAGVSDLQSTNDSQLQVRRSQKIVEHPKYQPYKMGANDLALIRLKKPFNLKKGSVEVLQLSGRIWKPFKHSCKTIGWGLVAVNPDVTGTVLKALNVTARHGKHACPCFSNWLQPKVLCLEPSVLGSPCSGDSGGPLLCGGLGVGVTHLAYDTSTCRVFDRRAQDKVVCGKKATRVMYMYLCPYLNWIRGHVDGVPRTPTSCLSTALLTNDYLILAIYVIRYLVSLCQLTTIKYNLVSS